MKTNQLEACRICSNTVDNKYVTAKEMMFGFRDEFEYMECGSCKCIQITTIPDNISKYYPDNYYSYTFKGEDEIIQSSVSKTLKRGLKKALLNSYLQDKGMLGKWIAPKFNSYYPWIRKNMLKNTSAILDVGCGTGELLLRMYNDGFRNLTGLDPFIRQDIHYKCGIVIHKKNIEDLKGTFDLIMMHHAYEHMDHPLDVLKKLSRLLRPGGIILIRIPIGDSYAWKKYGVNWVQLDAPRHFFLHTPKSMEIMSRQAGLDLIEIMYDSYELQFSGSEKYLRGIPLMDKIEIFTPEEINKFNEEARHLNERKEGDAACFYLQKPFN